MYQPLGSPAVSATLIPGLTVGLITNHELVSPPWLVSYIGVSLLLFDITYMCVSIIIMVNDKGKGEATGGSHTWLCMLTVSVYMAIYTHDW